MEMLFDRFSCPFHQGLESPKDWIAAGSVKKITDFYVVNFKKGPKDFDLFWLVAQFVLHL